MRQRCLLEKIPILICPVSPPSDSSVDDVALCFYPFRIYSMEDAPLTFEILPEMVVQKLFCFMRKHGSPLQWRK